MNVSYDVKVDALYITFVPGDHEVVTTTVDEDIALDFDERDRLVGMEIVGASKRLDLRYLFPVQVTRDDSSAESVTSVASGSERRSKWERIARELLRRIEQGIPIETLDKGRRNWIEEVGEDYVIVRRDTGNTRRISRNEIEGRTKREWYVTRAIRELAS